MQGLGPRNYKRLVVHDPQVADEFVDVLNHILDVQAVVLDAETVENVNVPLALL